MTNLSLNKPVQVIAITAGKGGVGKSNVAINLAIALAQAKKNVMVLDADLGLGNLDILLGLHPRQNLSHVIQGQCTLNDIILQGPCGISVIPASSGVDFMTRLVPAELAGIVDSFNEVTDDLDYMIIDTAAGISDTVLSFARSSQELVVMVCDEPTSLSDAYSLIKVMRKRYDITHYHILVNMVRSAKEGRDLFNSLFKISEQFLDVHLEYLGSIPFDEKVHLAVKKQQAVVIAYPDSFAAEAFRQISLNVMNWPNQPFLGGNTSFFLQRLATGEF